MRALLHTLLLLTTSLLIAAVVLGCGPTRGGGGGGGGAELGAACDEDEFEDDVHRCDGSFALECKVDDEGGFVWEGKDCADLGERCVEGKCRDSGAANNDDGQNNDDGNNDGGDCPDRSGVWSFEENCDPSLVGTEYVITQTGCELTVASVGWSGSVDADGVVTIGGPVPGGNLSCIGQSTEARLEATCVPTCDVVLVR